MTFLVSKTKKAAALLGLLAVVFMAAPVAAQYDGYQVEVYFWGGSPWSWSSTQIAHYLAISGQRIDPAHIPELQNLDGFTPEGFRSNGKWHTERLHNIHDPSNEFILDRIDGTVVEYRPETGGVLNLYMGLIQLNTVVFWCPWNGEISRIYVEPGDVVDKSQAPSIAHLSMEHYTASGWFFYDWDDLNQVNRRVPFEFGVTEVTWNQIDITLNWIQHPLVQFNCEHNSIWNWSGERSLFLPLGGGTVSVNDVPNTENAYGYMAVQDGSWYTRTIDMSTWNPDPAGEFCYRDNVCQSMQNWINAEQCVSSFSGTVLSSCPVYDYVKFDFDEGSGGTMVTEDVVLWLGWTPLHRVEFRSEHSPWGEPAARVGQDVFVLSGGMVDADDIPSTDHFQHTTGFVMDGSWYTRTQTSPGVYDYVKFDFAEGGTGGTPVNSDVSLWLGWEPAYSVIFCYQYDPGQHWFDCMPSLNIAHAGTIAPSQRPQIKDLPGMVFNGSWYTDSLLTQQFTFGVTPVTGNIHLWAGWDRAIGLSFLDKWHGERIGFINTDSPRRIAANEAPEVDYARPGNEFEGNWFYEVMTTPAVPDPNGRFCYFGSNEWGSGCYEMEKNGISARQCLEPEYKDDPTGVLVSACPVFTSHRFEFGGSGTLVDKDMSLFVEWKRLSYVISFSLNNGSDSGKPDMILVDASGSGVTVPVNLRPSTAGYSRFGHVLASDNWYTRADRYENGEWTSYVYTPFIFGPGGTQLTEDVELYLRWEVDTEWFEPLTAGSGTSADPYIITTPKQLAYIALMTNNNADGQSWRYADAHYVLGANIDLSAYGAGFNGGRGWVPIRDFRGDFNGAGHKITGLYINDPDRCDAGLFNRIYRGSSAARLRNVGLEGVDITARCRVGGLAGGVTSWPGEEHGSGIEYVYVLGSVRGASSSVGGIVGELRGELSYLRSSYSTADVAGTNYVGGLAGTSDGLIERSVALNRSVESDDGSNARIASTWSSEDYGFTGNWAFSDMEGSSDGWSPVGANTHNGQSITRSDLGPDLNGEFTAARGFMIAANRLPGFGGASVPMPAHLGGPSAVQTPDRNVVPQQPDAESAAAEPSNALTGEFTAGPNPSSRSFGRVDFFRTGKSIQSGTLTVFDASGNAVNRVRINDNARHAPSRRVVGTWNLTDRRGRPVAEGTYLLRGTVTASDGSKERVSVVIGVR